MPEIDKENILGVLHRNPEEGLGLLYERYGKRLYSYAIFSWKISEDDAWELIYKTLLKTISAYKRYDFESESKFASFIFSIFCNALRRHYRDEKKKSERIQFLHFDEALFEKATNTASLKTERDIQAKLIEDFFHAYWQEKPDKAAYLNCVEYTLDELKDWERILLLQRAQNIPYAEIAQYVDKPVEQLKVYYQRARKKFVELFMKRVKELKQERDRHESQS